MTPGPARDPAGGQPPQPPETPPDATDMPKVLQGTDDVWTLNTRLQRLLSCLYLVEPWGSGQVGEAVSGQYFASEGVHAVALQQETGGAPSLHTAHRTSRNHEP